MKDLEIGSFEAKNRLSELLAQAARGQRIFITRHGKRVALLGPAEDRSGTADGRAASLVKRLARFRENTQPGRESIRDLIEAGRR